MDALIGYTGFVGSTLRRQHDFEGLFNSGNIGDAEGRSFGTVVCAAAPGSMFEANRDPERDLARTEAIIRSLEQIGSERFVLISSVACLKDFRADNEESTAFEDQLPYGKHRRLLEARVAERSGQVLVVRLPALFGPGLKKNFLFDILNPMPTMLTEADFASLKGALAGDLASDLAATLDRIYTRKAAGGLFVIDRAALDDSGTRAHLEASVIDAGLAAMRFTHPDSEFQFYDMSRLWADIQRGLESGIAVLHLAPQPVRAGVIYQALVGQPMPVSAAKVHREDMRTGQSWLWRREGPYIATEAEIVRDLRAFTQRERAQAPADAA
ncbi:hypothetical protein WSK_2558 [Novosphingobium sp. Rr 2-17]|uniref:NAD(P)-dependent oxidoreductase n=1 Tax=Novosphingobium sp. Rr 2-17 TaxID=555793 RepID=UPI0002697ED2|nr:NAD(P)-dependent oxidoreductase [Novosphingobium sp. Rr 2-17]EIZ79013.1 hypothetical protein WSK_2558 [Novosphingobium sp. Rr 2-17]